MELRDDVTTPELGGLRWLTVAPTGSPTLPLPLWPRPDRRVRRRHGRPAQDPGGKGAAGGRLFSTDDCQTRDDELKRRAWTSRRSRPSALHGIDAAPGDPSGN